MASFDQKMPLRPKRKARWLHHEGIWTKRAFGFRGMRADDRLVIAMYNVAICAAF